MTTGKHAVIKVPSPQALERLVAQAVPLGVSINDDWANAASDVAQIVEDLTPLLVGVQEGFRRRYRHDLGRRWGVFQRHDSDATAGVAVIWDRHRCKSIGPRRDQHPERIGHGWQALDHTKGLRTRGVCWDDLQLIHPLPGIPNRFRVASWHRDPERFEEHWPDFDHPALRWLRKSPLPTIVFQDSNQQGGPDFILDHLGKAYAWHADGEKIDGAIVHRAFHAGPVVSRPRQTSDHDAAVIPLGVTA